VDRVLIKEGQQVKAGDVLVELNAAATKANFESIRQNYMAQRAAEGRLMAEISDLSAIRFHNDLLASSNDPVIKQHIVIQTELFNSRRSAFRNEIGATMEALAGLEAQQVGLKNQIESRSIQSAKQSEQLKNISELAAEGFVPRNQVLQLEQAEAELRSILSDLQANFVRNQRSIAELKLRLAQRKQEFTKDSATQLADVRREVQAGQERLSAISDDLGRVNIKAPIDGQVVGLILGSVGGVVSAGQKLMDIVPVNESMVLEAKIPTYVIDRVKASEITSVRFSAFAHSPELVIDGKVNSISGDVISENTMNGPISYYLARIEITPAGIKQLGDRVMQPGMQAEVLIKTGERTLLTYLLHPLTKRIASSLKEE
jgi:protease secretion system membrane fusion protein